MKGKRLSALLAVALVLTAVGAATAFAHGGFWFNHGDSQEKAVVAALHDRDPKNVIFLLGDGMGIGVRTAARVARYGVARGTTRGWLEMDRFPTSGMATVIGST